MRCTHVQKAFFSNGPGPKVQKEITKIISKFINESIALSFITILTILLTFLVAPLTPAQDTPSPAGGGWLALPGDNGSCVAANSKTLDMPQDGLTVEAWIYPIDIPKQGEVWTIIVKPGCYLLGIKRDIDPNRNSDFAIYVKVGGLTVCGHPMNLRINQWNHIGFILDTKHHIRGTLFNGTATLVGTQVPGIVRHSLADLYVGTNFSEAANKGLINDADWFVKAGFSRNFIGFFDEVRISGVVRYVAEKEIKAAIAKPNGIAVAYPPPESPYKNDEHTLGLWHFDEVKGSILFADSSGNGNKLIGKNGVMTVGEGKSLETQGKLATTWGFIRTIR